MQLSPNFSLEELTRSQTALRMGLDNAASPAVMANLARLCADLLEPVRSLLAVPLYVDSGYRCVPLNILIGGARNSAHLDGRAADIVPIGMTLNGAFLLLQRNTTLPLDQCIIECDAWLHLSVAPMGVAPRRVFMTCSGSPANWVYHVV